MSRARSLSAALAAIVALQILAVFSIEWYAVTRIGLDRSVDAVFVGMTVPQLVLQVISGSLTYTLVPLLAVESGDEFAKTGWTFLWLVGGVFLVFAIVLWLLAPFWVPLTVPGFEPEARAMATKMTRIQLPGVAGEACNGVLIALWQARGRFMWPAASELIAAVVAVMIVILGVGIAGAETIAWAQLAIVFGQTLLLWPILGRPCLPSLHSPEIREAWRRMRPLLAGSTYYKTDALVNRALASFLPPGSVVLLSLGQRIHSAGATILSVAIASPIVPSLAKYARSESWRSFHALARQRLGWMFAATGAAMIVLLVVGRPLLSLIFERGQFTAEDVRILWWVLIALGGVQIAGGLGQIYSTAFYAAGDTRTPTRIGVVGYTAGILFKIVGLAVGQLYGVAAAASAYRILNVFAFERAFHRLGGIRGTWLRWGRESA
jgi:putative peptidoglycan lipid II flippase